MKNKNFYYAVASLVGATIGVGIFGIPYVVAKTGFIWGMFSLIFLGLVSLLINLFYGEVVLATKENHRLVGYAKKYLNKWEQKVAIFAFIFSCYGSMLAYLIVGGEFLHILFNGFFGFDAFTYTLVFFAVSSYLIFLGLKIVAKGELIMTYFLLLTIIVLFVKCAGSIEPTNLATLNLSDWFLPYGVILFALSGSVVIPYLKEVLGKDQQLMKKTILWGTTIPIIVCAFFIFLVVGITGEMTTKEAIYGLDIFFGDGIILLGAIFGFLAVATSFLLIGLTLKETFWYDFKIPHFISWLLACFVPFIIFLIGLRNFTEVISFVGAIAGGLTGILIIGLHESAKKKKDISPAYSISIPWFIQWGLITLFSLGIVYEIIFR
jgi:tyrosine-specific transport protein